MNRMRATSKAGIILGLGALLFNPCTSLGQAPERAPVVTTPRFAFYNDFDTNLNDALNAAGVARKAGKPELFHSGDEVSCFEKLPPSARAGWNKAVDYYAEIISPAAWDARQQYLLRVDLAGFDEQVKDAGARQFVEIARGFRGAAAPAYKARAISRRRRGPSGRGASEARETLDRQPSSSRSKHATGRFHPAEHGNYP